MEPALGSFELSREDGARLFVYRWLPRGEVRLVVQVLHGMAEHAGRYARVAGVLTGAGYAVYANDHRGHGKTARIEGDLGYFADADGFQALVDDAHALTRHVAEAHPGVPVVLLGHSMGAMLAEGVLLRHGDALAGAVLSGATGHAPLAGVGRVLARAERARLGRRGKSALLQQMSFSGFNRGFEGRTEFDWLSRDTAEVDGYIADPRCGFELCTQAWVDVLDGIRLIEDRTAMRAIPKTLPVYVFAGTDDPVGRRTRGPRWLVDAYRAAGLTDVTSRFYPGGRHEMLNEINRDEVHADLLAWLRRVLDARAA